MKVNAQLHPDHNLGLLTQEFPLEMYPSLEVQLQQLPKEMPDSFPQLHLRVVDVIVSEQDAQHPGNVVVGFLAKNRGVSAFLPLAEAIPSALGRRSARVWLDGVHNVLARDKFMLTVTVQVNAL